MITFLLILGLVIALGLCTAEFILIKILLRKISAYEEWIRRYESWILDCKQEVTNTLESMRAIDSKGAFATRVDDKGKFESDDEVGVIFKDLLDLIEKLDQRIQ